MAVSYNQNLGVWQVNGRGSFASQAEAAAADSGAAPAAGAPPANDTSGFGSAPAVAQPAAPLAQAPQRTAPPAPAQPFQPYVGGYVGGRTVSGGASYDPTAAAHAASVGNQGATAGYAAGNQKTRDTYDSYRGGISDTEQGLVNWADEKRKAALAAVGSQGGTRGLPASPAAAGIAPPQNVTTDPGLNVPRTTGPAPAPATVDRTAYDQAAQGLTQARNDFYSELTRLSGVDPFGNQAFLQKATDRAVAQAAGTAAGARGGAAALAGANRQAVGVQAQTSARGSQEVAEQARRDAIQAAQLRVQTVGGIADVNQQLSQNEIQLSEQALKAGDQNLRAYLGGRELDQNEKESVRRLSTEVAKIDMQRYQTDTQYRESVNNNLTAMYQSDNALKAAKMQVDAQENLSPSEWMMGLVGMGTGLAAGVMKSDRRSKTAIKPAKVSELKEYLSSAPGSHYRYRQPSARGQRAGENFGPMAQSLQKTRIGRTVVVEKDDGLYVDTGRLALADHGALSYLAERVERLAARLEKKKK